MKRKLELLCLLVWVSTVLTNTLSAATVSIGNYSTLSSSITIPVLISGGEQLTDMAGLLVVGDGGTIVGSAPVPKITAVNYDFGSIWESALGGYTTSSTPIFPLPSEIFFPNLSLNTTGQSVSANGTLLSFTLDLSGFSQGSTFSLAMNYPPASAATQFAISNGSTITPFFINGSVTIGPNIPATVTWNTASGSWNTVTANWIGGNPAPNHYKQGDNVIFDNSAIGGTVTVAPAGVSPLSTIVNNDSSHPYTIQNSVGDLNGIKTGSLTKSGNGTLTLSGTNTYTGTTTVNSGTLDVTPLGSIDTSQTIIVGLGANYIANHLRPNTASISGDVTIRADGGINGASKVESLNLTVTGKLNLKDNDMVVGTAVDVNAVRSAIKTGVAGAKGITSDLPAFGISTGFGYALGNDSNLSSSLGGSLTGQSYDDNSVLVKYTFLGDADLDGDSDLNDLGFWAQSFTGDLGNPLIPVTYWTSGDFDYDGDTDLNDLGFWASTFTGDLGGGVGSLIVVAPNAPVGAIAALNSMSITVVPEPGALLCSGIGIALMTIVLQHKNRQFLAK